MRALQELIPHCNKVVTDTDHCHFIVHKLWKSCQSCCYVTFREQTDKASMLDEAIEYLKSLQLQLQVSATATAASSPPCNGAQVTKPC